MVQLLLLSVPQGRHFLFAQMGRRLFLLLDPLQEQNKAYEGLVGSFLDFL